MKDGISITLDVDLITLIEKRRGLVDRSSFIEEILKKSDELREKG